MVALDEAAARIGVVCVVWGETYERWAKELYASGKGRFRPGHVNFYALPGRAGWPAATLYRYHVLLERQEEIRGDWLFLLDADMRFEGQIGPEILGDLVAVEHPGYAGGIAAELPYEYRPESVARVRPREGTTYFAGGLVGGERGRFLDLAGRIVAAIDEDDRRGVVARWHDESHLNRQLIDDPPSTVLSPSYCFPDDASAYPWLAGVERRIVALDKTPAERGRRDEAGSGG